MSEQHIKYMQRCLNLAKKAAGNTSPNPMVGSVIVHNDTVIGEGFHRKCGEAHAEVNAVNSVKDKSLLKNSTLYVSLEPCAHVGKTPSCANMIIENKIPKIVIGSLDPFSLVNGKGIEMLKNAGRQTVVGVLEKECVALNKRFYTYHLKKRPYIILKWAQTKDGYIDYIRKPGTDTKAFWITNEYCKTLVHKWRCEEDAIFTGTNTIILDNPQLTARNWFGKNPLRISIDEYCNFDKNYKIFDNQAETLIFNSLKTKNENNLKYYKIDFNNDIVDQILNKLYELGIQSLIVEGGSVTLESFISKGLWDEARIFTGNHKFGKGVCAPAFNHSYHKYEKYGNSELKYYYNNEFV
jgi:diaminohydroxyphosphoribosylaminopyrimidine deaminase / 5-amino-6-(5-phosphoribosylamino)uracil reductase